MSRIADLRRWLRGDDADLALPAPGFGGAAVGDPDRIVDLRLRRPIVAGSIVVLVLVFGLLIWAAVFSIAGAVVAGGTVRVENNVKQIKSRTGGTVRAILVREGDKVRAGQPLIRFDRVQNQAGVDIFQSQYDIIRAEIARYQAEARDADAIDFPADLLARTSDPQVGALVAGQRALFASRMTLYRTQAQILASQARQLGTQIEGMQAQMRSIDAQSDLIDDELRGVRDLNSIGYAPRTRLLALERSVAAVRGQRGSLTSDMARSRQAIGDIRIQIAQLADKRETDAAQGLRDSQDKLTEIVPKLRASQQDLAETVIRAPAAGYVFNLTQFTVGGVAGSGETLMQIVPSDAPMIITAEVRPNDIAEVRPGMPARVTLTAYNPRTTPEIDGRVVLVGADAITDPQSRASYYQVQVKIEPGELAKAGPQVRLTPGMPAMVSIVTGKRTILDYILGPMTESMRTALKER